MSTSMCDQCDAVMINGVKCHEAGCPDAWRDRQVECLFCGSEFIRDDKYQKLCDESCADGYYGGRL